MTGALPAAQAPSPAAAGSGLLSDATSANPLDAALLAAHVRDDRRALVGLYAEAAYGCAGTARAFYLTHAFIFALELGDPRAAPLKADLVKIGADIP